MSDTNSQENQETTPIKHNRTAPPFFLIFILPLAMYAFGTFKLFMEFKKSDFSDQKIVKKIGLFKVILFVVAFFIIYGLVVQEMSKTCDVGTNNFALSALLYTFVPLVFIFGTIIVLLTVAPGWKSPFSNTIGFFIVKNIIERKLFKVQDWIVGESNTNNDAAKQIRIFNNNNKTYFINELTPTNFNNALDKLSIGPDKTFPFKKKVDEDPESVEVEEALYRAVVIKDLISEAIWLLIGATLSFSTSHVYSLGHKCGDITDEDSLGDMIDTDAAEQQLTAQSDSTSSST